jgi:hypothetical protein
MKTGGDLSTVLQEVRRVEESKKDFIAPKGLLSMVVLETERIRTSGTDPDQDGKPAAGPAPRIQFKAGDRHYSFNVRKRAHDQMAQELGIPGQYYKRMLEADPELLAVNVNRWMGQDRGTRRMVRTIDGDMRAYLSDRYRPLDNFDLAEAVLPILMGDGIKVESLALTEDRFYLKAVNARMTKEVKVGDPVQMGIVVSNSEVGAGALKVEPLIYRLACLNGMIREDMRTRKYHVGRRTGEDGEDAASRFFSDETRRLDNKAFFAKVRDTVAGGFNEAFFSQEVEKLQAAAGAPIVEKIEDVMERISDRHGLNETERGSVLDAFIKGGDLTRYGLANAVTLTAQGVDSYDRSQELERIGGRLIDSLIS